MTNVTQIYSPDGSVSYSGANLPNVDQLATNVTSVTFLAGSNAKRGVMYIATTGTVAIGTVCRINFALGGVNTSLVSAPKSIQLTCWVDGTATTQVANTFAAGSPAIANFLVKSSATIATSITIGLAYAVEL